MRIGGWCGDYAGEIRVEEPEVLETGGATVLRFKGGRFEMGYPMGMPVGVDGGVSFQTYADGEMVETSGTTMVILGAAEGVQQHVEVIGIAAHLRHLRQENVLTQRGGRRVRLKWAGSESDDVRAYRVYGNGGAGAVNYGTEMDEVEGSPGGARLSEVEWRSGELADGLWRFGVRTVDEAGNVAETPTRETGEIEVKGPPRAAREVGVEYDVETEMAEVRWKA